MLTMKNQQYAMAPKKYNKAFKRNKNSGLRFASLHILTHYFCPLNAALTDPLIISLVLRCV